MRNAWVAQSGRSKLAPAQGGEAAGGKAPGEELYNFAKDLFAEHDGNGNGVLDVSELTSMVRAIWEKLDQSITVNVIVTFIIVATE